MKESCVTPGPGPGRYPARCTRPRPRLRHDAPGPGPGPVMAHPSPANTRPRQKFYTRPIPAAQLKLKTDLDSIRCSIFPLITIPVHQILSFRGSIPIRYQKWHIFSGLFYWSFSFQLQETIFRSPSGFGANPNQWRTVYWWWWGRIPPLGKNLGLSPPLGVREVLFYHKFQNFRR